MEWLRKDRLFMPNTNCAWSRSHAQVPIIDKSPVDSLNDIYRIYYNSRNKNGETLPSYIHIKLSNDVTVEYIHDKPISRLGKIGCFDDSGVMASAIVNHHQKKYLFYTGWNLSTKPSYRLAIGLCVSEDNGKTFKKYSKGPIVDRNHSEPITCSQPFVMIENDIWRMWYLSYTHWVSINGKYEPCYNIKYAESNDGLNWKITGITCIDYLFENEAIAVPNVWIEDKTYYMMYSYRSSTGYRTKPEKSYKLGLAISNDGIKWERVDSSLLLLGKRKQWESVMNAYPNTISHKNNSYLFYNGNGFGQSGFGYATRKIL